MPCRTIEHSPFIIMLTIERMAIRKTLSKEVYAFIDTLFGGEFVFKPCIYPMPKTFQLSASST